MKSRGSSYAYLRRSGPTRRRAVLNRMAAGGLTFKAKTSARAAWRFLGSPCWIRGWRFRWSGNGLDALRPFMARVVDQDADRHRLHLLRGVGTQGRLQPL